MAIKIVWTPTADQKLCDMRGSGHTWQAVALDLHVGRSAVIERARQLGIAPAAAPPARPNPLPFRADRPSMPSGHPLSWGALTAGTSLDGEPYPLPVFL